MQEIVPGENKISHSYQQLIAYRSTFMGGMFWNLPVLPFLYPHQLNIHPHFHHLPFKYLYPNHPLLSSFTSYMAHFVIINNYNCLKIHTQIQNWKLGSTNKRNVLYYFLETYMAVKLYSNCFYTLSHPPSPCLYIMVKYSSFQ